MVLLMVVMVFFVESVKSTIVIGFNSDNHPRPSLRGTKQSLTIQGGYAGQIVLKRLLRTSQ
jgi:hypothetical protein